MAVSTTPDYLRARYYDPATAQLTTRDPAVGVTNQPYDYVDGNPLNLVDPSGLKCVGAGVGLSSNFGVGDLGYAFQISFGIAACENGDIGILSTEGGFINGSQYTASPATRR
ncbi:MAG: hypothetical protein QOE92_492 [Chloroflexota bacterium]|jgi:hypothetical protein|nr:hypothetical protein [Chloroflexota bacterium]